MIQKIIQSSYFYSLSIGLHIAVLLTFLNSINIQAPVTPPTISASVYFETPKKIVIQKKSTKKIAIKAKKNVTKTKNVSPVPKKVTPVPEKITSVPEKVTPVPKKVTPVPEKVTPELKKITAVPEKVTPEFKMLTPEFKMITPVPEKVIPKPEKVTPVPEKVIPEPEKVISEPEKVIPVPKKVMPEPEKVMPVPEKVMPEPEVVTPVPEKVIPEPEVVTPEPEKVMPEPEMISPEPEKVIPEPEVVTLEPEKVIPEPEVVTPEPEVVTPKPEVIATRTETQKIVEAPVIIKPQLKTINSQNLPVNDNSSENLNLTSENPLDLKGFLRANQLTQKQKIAPSNNVPSNNVPSNKGSLTKKSVTVKRKFKVNPLVKSSSSSSSSSLSPSPGSSSSPSVSSSPSAISNSNPSSSSSPPKQIINTPVLEEDSTTTTNIYDDLFAEMGVDDDESDSLIFSTQWLDKKEKKIFQKSLFLQISEHWVLPRIAMPKFQVVVAVLITNKGRIKKIDFKEYAPVAIINIAVERTLRRAEPFDNVPDSMLQSNGEYKAIFKFSANQVAN